MINLHNIFKLLKTLKTKLYKKIRKIMVIITLLKKGDFQKINILKFLCILVKDNLS